MQDAIPHAPHPSRSHNQQDRSGYSPALGNGCPMPCLGRPSKAPKQRQQGAVHVTLLSSRPRCASLIPRRGWIQCIGGHTPTIMQLRVRASHHVSEYVCVRGRYRPISPSHLTDFPGRDWRAHRMPCYDNPSVPLHWEQRARKSPPGEIKSASPPTNICLQVGEQPGLPYPGR